MRRSDSSCSPVSLFLQPTDLHTVHTQRNRDKMPLRLFPETAEDGNIRLLRNVDNQNICGQQCNIFGSKTEIDKDSNIASHNTASSGIQISKFRRRLLPPSSGL